MMELLQTLSEVYNIRALIASSMVGVSCGIIGCFIVLRNMSLIGDALSHSILPGIVVAFMIFGYNTFGFFVGAVLAGLFTAVAITWIQRNSQTKNDTAVGIVFIAMFSIGVIGISKVSRGGVHLDLKDFLFGTVMGISDSDVYLTFVVMLVIMLSVIVFYRYLFITTFQETIAKTMGINANLTHYFLMLLLSFAIVSALQTVGVIPVIALLITPAATALLLSDNLKNVVFLSATIGVISSIVGMIISIVLDTVPGPTICLVATVFYLTAVFFSPKKGIIIRLINKRKQGVQIQKEDIVKYIYKNKTKEKLNIDSISERLNLSKAIVTNNLKQLTNDGITQLKNNQISLSIKGKQTAEKLVRAHRLWETYLVNKTGLTEGQIHMDAEKLEHLLTPEMVDEMDEKLGYPDQDPHGSPIPQKKDKPKKSLLSLRPRDRGTIAKNQINQWVESELWELGLIPDSNFKVSKITQDSIVIETRDKKITIEGKLAQQINIKS